jgi:hypothetical protein
MSDDDDDLPDLGTCCGCGGSERVCAIGFLPQRGPVRGKGWGCAVCGLPMDGAVVVMCDACDRANVNPRFVCVGYPKENERMAIEELAIETFEHDKEKHRLDDLMMGACDDDDE